MSFVEMRAFRPGVDTEEDFHLHPRSVVKISGGEGEEILALIHLLGLELTGVSYPTGPLRFWVVDKKSGRNQSVPPRLQGAGYDEWRAYLSEFVGAGCPHEVDTTLGQCKITYGQHLAE